jgi:hypothetical protein
MFSTKHLFSRGLLLAGAFALPLAGGAALAQTTVQAPSIPATTAAPATTTAPAAAATGTVKADAGKTDTGKTVATKTDKTKTDKTKHLGAMKMTPAEKKAAHDKGATVTKTSAVKKARVGAKAATVKATAGTAGKSSTTAPVTQ